MKVGQVASSTRDRVSIRSPFDNSFRHRPRSSPPAQGCASSLKAPTTVATWSRVPMWA